jgi:hypothetical protein
MVLRATAGAIDRGACVVELSQYPGEVRVHLLSRPIHTFLLKPHACLTRASPLHFT